MLSRKFFKLIRRITKRNLSLVEIFFPFLDTRFKFGSSFGSLFVLSFELFFTLVDVDQSRLIDLQLRIVLRKLLANGAGTLLGRFQLFRERIQFFFKRLRLFGFRFDKV